MMRLGYITINGIKYSLPRYYLKKDSELDNEQSKRQEAYEQSKEAPSLKDVDYRIRTEQKKVEQVKANYNRLTKKQKHPFKQNGV